MSSGVSPRQTNADERWEDDMDMQRLMARKRRLEELEEYNWEETLAKKRMALRRQAKIIPAVTSSTDLQFDDDMSLSTNTSDRAMQSASQQFHVTKRNTTPRANCGVRTGDTSKTSAKSGFIVAEKRATKSRQARRRLWKRTQRLETAKQIEARAG